MHGKELRHVLQGEELRNDQDAAAVQYSAVCNFKS